MVSAKAALQECQASISALHAEVRELKAGLATLQKAIPSKATQPAVPWQRIEAAIREQVASAMQHHVGELHPQTPTKTEEPQQASLQFQQQLDVLSKRLDVIAKRQQHDAELLCSGLESLRKDDHGGARAAQYSSTALPFLAHSWASCVANCQSIDLDLCPLPCKPCGIRISR